MLAEMLNKYDIGGFDPLFVQNPDMQLTYWEPARILLARITAHPFCSLPTSWAALAIRPPRRWSPTRTTAWTASTRCSKTLRSRIPQSGAQLTADDVFADWTVANYLDDQSVAGGRYYYNLYPQAPKVSPTETYQHLPGQRPEPQRSTSTAPNTCR